MISVGRREDVHHPAALRIGLEEVVDVEHRLAEEALAALVFELEQRALDGANRRHRDVPVASPEFAGVLADKREHRAQVLQIEQQQPGIVGNLERHRQDALLRWLMPSRRPRINGPRSEIVARTGMPRRPNTSHSTTGLARHAGSATPVAASRSFSFAVNDPAAASPVKSPLTSARNTGTPMRREMIGEHLQRDRLAGSRRAGDQAVAVGDGGTEEDVGAAAGAGDRKGLSHAAIIICDAIRGFGLNNLQWTHRGRRKFQGIPAATDDAKILAR